MDKIDVFISRKSADSALAKKLYDFLTKKGLIVFESDETLPVLGNSDYRKAIDMALDECTHMIVVGSSIKNINSSWVEAEWGFYITEKRAERKNGNIISVITYNISIENLPASLRNYEVIYLRDENLEKIYAYAGGNANGVTIKKYDRPFYYQKWFMPSLILFLALWISGIYFYNYLQPFNTTVFVTPSDNLPLNKDYPAFNGGKLILWLNNKEETRELLSNGEADFKEIPASYFNKKIAIKVKAKNWRGAVDSIVLSKSITFPIVPDNSLGRIFGNVEDINGVGVSNVIIRVNTDTTIVTDSSGSFDMMLPYKMQKTEYQLYSSKQGFKPKTLTYFGGTTSITIQLLK